MAAQVNAGKLLLLEVSEDGGTTFMAIGGIKTKELTFDNPAIDATNQSTALIAGTSFTESVFNGFSTVTLSGDGVIDKRFDASTVSAYNLVSKATSGDRSAYLRLTDGTSGGSITVEGTFILTSFSISADIQDLENFSISAQSGEAVEVTVTEPA